VQPPDKICELVELSGKNKKPFHFSKFKGTKGLLSLAEPATVEKSPVPS